MCLCFGGLRDVLTAWDSHKGRDSRPALDSHEAEDILSKKNTHLYSQLWIHGPYLWLCPSLALNRWTWLFILLHKPNNFWISDLAGICPQHPRALAMFPASEMFLWVWSQLIQFTQHWSLFCSLIKAQNWGKLVRPCHSSISNLQFSSFLAFGDTWWSLTSRRLFSA